MKTTFLVNTLLFHADIPLIEHLWTPPLAVGLAGLGISLGLALVLRSLRNAPEGYEDEEGFHFTQARPAIGQSVGLAILRLHNAG